ncbi:hypothetical protein ABZ791_02390 [Streptomyces huasconensis]|uniref:Uncharacterized protein n=1 Tax=Streptomyces huasconensis TaxID=1854574 RepID=A0ABV3LUJ4_9ACTN
MTITRGRCWQSLVSRRPAGVGDRLARTLEPLVRRWHGIHEQAPSDTINLGDHLAGRITELTMLHLRYTHHQEAAQ